ncbi:MAG: hypothetical protein K9H64_21910 [Bacteroidales bacterium]|nr:hypothetical protein [Bacteroidales bacterium]MCF8458684.1 hypothetical protein [Bacteroidales bacterium]
MEKSRITKTFKKPKGILISGIAFLIFGIGLLYVWITGWEIDDKGELFSVITMSIIFFFLGVLAIISYLGLVWKNRLS